MSKELDELVSFLRPDQNEVVRLNATNMVLQLSADQSGAALVTGESRIIEALIQLTRDPHPTVGGKAYAALVNLSASSPAFGDRLVSRYEVVPTFVGHITDKESELADKSCMLLSNLSRQASAVHHIVKGLEKMEMNTKEGRTWLDELLSIFYTVGYNKKKCKLDYLAPFFANLVQVANVRKQMMDKTKDHMKNLVTFLKEETTSSAIRRGGVVSIFKNLSFQYEYHEWLMSDEVDLLTHLLLPLAGAEEFTDEEMDKLPLDLQYLDEGKQRESDPDIRKLLVECLTMLCAQRKGRELMREQNIHLIIDNLIKWETSNGEESNVRHTENLLQLLVSKEEDDVDNLMTS